MQAGIGVCLWESVSLSAAADLTLVNECTFLEELLTFGGPNLCVWEHDGRGTEQLGGTIGAAFLAAFQLAGTWHDASPACSLTKIIAAFLERKKNPILWQSAAGGFLAEALSAGGCLWQSCVTELGIVTQECSAPAAGAEWMIEGAAENRMILLDRNAKVSLLPCSWFRTWGASRACADVTSSVLNEYFMFGALVTICQAVQGLARSCL